MFSLSINPKKIMFEYDMHRRTSIIIEFVSKYDESKFKLLIDVE